jgi:Flp pilus assembly protein protease CpaA
MSDIFIIENLFLIIVALIWILVAIVQDFRKLEVANWWNFSFIIIAISYRAFLSVAQWEYRYFMWGIIGLGIGWLIANLFYYAKIFAGGDAKLLFALGAVLPLSFNWKTNVEILIWFLALFLVSGALYGVVYSLVLVILRRKEFSKEFNIHLKKHKVILGIVSIIGLLIFAYGFFNGFILLWLGVLIFVSPWLLVYAKSIEEACLTKLVSPKEVTTGDYIVNSVKIGKKVICPNWQGLSDLEADLLKRGYKRKILIRYGIPFTPGFLFGLILMLVIFWFNLNSLIILF